MILRRNFSKMQDQDYIDREEDRKRSVKHAKGAGTVIGGATGGVVGHALTSGVVKSKKGKLAAVAAGAAAGATVGRMAGKAIKKSTEDDANRKIKRYKSASEQDKKYLREKEERELDRKVQERQARAQEQTAWNTRRW